MALRYDSTQPLLIPLNHDVDAEDSTRITVHLAISDSRLESAANSLLGRNPRFSVVKGGLGYAAESDVRIIDEAPNVDQQRELDELTPPKLLFIGGKRTDEALIEAARAGAWSFVSESVDAADLESAICSIMESKGSPLLKQLAMSDLGSETLLREFSVPREEDSRDDESPNPLTELEIRILDLVARGDSSRVIGEAVDLGEQTIKNYVVRILDKTHTHNRAHAAAYAAQCGWLSPIEIV